MKALRNLLGSAALLLLLLPICGFAPDSAPLPAQDIIATAAPVYAPLAALHPAGASAALQDRFPKGAQLLLIHEGRPEPLVKDFAASADAQVSFDGKSVLFSGRQKAGDPWQIWEMKLSDRSMRRVVAGPADLVRPFYLPGGRLIYARRGEHGFQIEAADLDGSHVTQLTFLPAGALPADVLQDGRILFEASWPLGAGSTPEMFLVYSDGSGVESYRCDHGRPRWGGKQLASGDVVFTHGASLARFTSPLAHEERVMAPHAEYAGAIAETPSGAWLLSARNAAGSPYALKLWNPGAASAQTILSIAGQNLLQPVLIAERNRPRQHPTGLHPWNYGNLLALDARDSREGALKTAPASVRMEMMDPAGRAVSMGTAPVESDGSFFVKAPGDRPIRFALLDGKGSVLRQEHGWIWIRSGEQRICVGCHVGPERASENIVPAVLLRSTEPEDLTGAKTAEDRKHTEGSK